MQLTPEFWIENTERAGDVLGDPEWVAAFNRRSYAIDPHLVDLATYPDDPLAQYHNKRAAGGEITARITFDKK